MKLIVIGCGRVGSTVARRMSEEGWNVTVIDEDEESLTKLGRWAGEFIVGHGLDLDVLVSAGMEEADAVVVSTDGDNTNIVIGLIAQKKFDNTCVVVRILDPGRAALFEKRGLRTVCPTSTAIDVLSDAVRSCQVDVGKAAV